MLVTTVSLGTVPVLTELGASVTLLAGRVSRTVEVSVCIGNTVVILVELGEVAISVGEVNTDTGLVGVEVTSPLGPISIHEVAGETGAIITDTESGHGVEQIKQLVVGSVAKVFREDVVGEVLVFKVEEGVVFAVEVETDSAVGAGREDRCVREADVKALVVTVPGVEAVDVRESTVSVAVTDDVVARREGISVAKDCVPTSPAGVRVAFQVDAA